MEAITLFVNFFRTRCFVNSRDAGLGGSPDFNKGKKKKGCLFPLCFLSLYYYSHLYINWNGSSQIQFLLDLNVMSEFRQNKQIPYFALAVSFLSPSEANVLPDTI